MTPSRDRNWYRFHAAVLSLALLSGGTLLAQQPAVTSGSASDTYTGFNEPTKIVQDSHGNLIYADGNAGAVYIIFAGTTTAVTLESGLSGAQGVTLDSAGNLYVAAPYPSTPVLQKIPYQNGAYNVANAVDLYSTLSSADGGYIQPSDVAVSSSGVVYVGELYCSSCNGLYYIFSENSDGSNPQQLPFDLPNFQPAQSLALDQYGNLSYADTQSVWTFNVNDSNPNPVQLSSDITSGVTADAAGNLIVNDGQAGADIKVIPIEGTSLNGADEYIGSNNTYGKFPVGYNKVSGELFTGDGYGAGNGNIRTSYIGGQNFGSSAVGVQVTGQAATFNFQVATTFSNIITVSEGSTTSNEFVFGTTGYTVCTAGQAYAAKSFCQLYSNFQPGGVGPRSGSIYLTNATGGIIGTLHEAGIGLGAEPGINGGAPTTLISSTAAISTLKLANPAGVAVDGIGNVYVADTLNDRVVELPAGTTTPVKFATGSVSLTDPTAIAVDGTGNVYIADGSGNKVVEVDVTGAATTLLSSATTVNGTAVSGINGIAVDGLGNVFVSDAGNDRIIRIPNYGPAIVQVSAATTFGGTALKTPAGIAVDGSDNIFIADSGNNRIVEYNSFGAATVAASQGATYSTPKGVAVDPAGDLYVADSNGVTAVYAGNQVKPISGLTDPAGVALDTNGNIYVADTGNSDIIELNTTNPSVNFGTVGVGSNGSATVAVYNIGNQPLTFSAAATLDSGDTTFKLDSNTCTTSNTIAVGGYCLISVGFSPSASGAATGTLTLSDNDPVSATQTITLSGTGGNSKTASTTALTVSPSSVTIGANVTLTAQVSPSTGKVPTGSVSFYADGELLATEALSSAAKATITGPTSGYPAGTYQITAVYTGDSNYSSSNSTASNLTLNNPSTVATSVTASAAPNPAGVGSTVTVTATVKAKTGSATPTGTVNFSVEGEALGSGKVGTNGVATFSASTAGLAPGTYPVTATYVPTGSFTGSSVTFNVVLTNSTKTALIASPTTVAEGGSVKLTATITGSGTTPTGSVTFKAGSTTIGSASVSGGVATLTAPTTGVPPGSYPVTAYYSGDKNNGASTSNTITVTITSADVRLIGLGHAASMERAAR